VAELPAKPEPLTLAGPAGALEALLAQPVAYDGKRAAIVCHPHPLHGGTLHNKVVHTMARTFEELGLASLCFNFRGVGASAGTFDDGVGETEDARAATDWVRKRWPGVGLWLAGFSFGAFVAARLAADPHVAPHVRQLVGVAPPVRRFAASGWVHPSAPWLIVQGDADDLVDANEVKRWAGSQVPPPRLVVLEGVGHFFHGRLHELKDLLRTQLAG
jgi:alpha/beta superfamily hydrolase